MRDRPQVGDPDTMRIRLLSRPCATCVIFPDDRAHLGDARRRAFIQDVLDHDSYVVCHATLLDGPPAVCRGFYNAHRRDTLALRLLDLYGFAEEVDPPTHGCAEPCAAPRPDYRGQAR